MSVARMLACIVDGDGGCGVLPTMHVGKSEGKPKIQKRRQNSCGSALWIGQVPRVPGARSLDSGCPGYAETRELTKKLGMPSSNWVERKKNFGEIGGGEAKATQKR